MAQAAIKQCAYDRAGMWMLLFVRVSVVSKGALVSRGREETGKLW